MVFEKAVAPSGAEYIIKYDGLYRFIGKKVPRELEGGFTSRKDAQVAFELYKAKQEQPVNLMTGHEVLSDLDSKADLLGFAEYHEIEIPSNIKQPTAIKKYLKEQLGCA